MGHVTGGAIAALEGSVIGQGGRRCKGALMARTAEFLAGGQEQRGAAIVRPVTGGALPGGHWGVQDGQAGFRSRAGMTIGAELILRCDEK